MKPLTPLLAVFAILGSIAFGMSQYFAAAAEKTKAASSEASLRLAQAEVESLKAQMQDLERRLLAFQAEADALRKKRAESVATNANSQADAESGNDETEAKKESPKNFMAGLGKMLKDPKMKEMMRKQQGLAVRMQYADLGKLLNLSAQDQERLMELLGDRQTVGMDMFTDITASGESPEKDAKMKEIDKQRADIEEQMKQVVGEEGMKEITKYEKSIPDRMLLDTAGNTLRASGMPIEDQQRNQLLAIMSEERAKGAENPFQPGNKNTKATMEAMGSPEKMESYIKDQEALLERVLNRSNTVLNPDQYTTFEKSMQGQLEMQKFGLQFMKNMGKEDEKGPVAVPVPVQR